jgi:hypothetical protein
MLEAEHVHFDDPRPRRHAVKAKSSAVIGQSHQDAITLRRLDGGALDHLAFGFHHPGLGQRRDAKQSERDRRYRQIAQGTNHVLVVMVAVPVLRLQAPRPPALGRLPAEQNNPKKRKR